MKVLKKVGGFVLGAVGAAIGFVVAGPVGAAVGFSVGMGIGTAVQMAAMKTKVPDVSSATTQRLNVSIDPDANRKIAFGETALGTDQVYWEAWGPESSYYDQVIAAAGHEIESFGKLYFDDEEVTFSGNNATGAYAGALTKADRTVGVSGTALTVGAGTKWTSACSLTGVAHYALRIQWSQEKFPRGIPSRVTRVGKGAKVYDPRRDSTRGGSGSHRADDQSTWEYSPTDSNGQPIGRNPALQILWYEIGWRVTNPDTSEEILTCGRGRPLDDIDFASFITAANDCEDEGYYSDVLLSTGDAHATNIAVLEAACAGKVMDTGGRISLRIRTDTTGDIVQAFTDADIIDTEAGVWRPSLPLSERWNQGRGSFVDPRALYRITPLPQPVRDLAYEAEDGWKRPGPEFRFDAVQDPDQAQKLIRLELNISRYMGVFTAPFNWRAKKVRIWDIVTLTSASDGFEDKLFRVLEKKTDPMGAIWLLLREDDPSIYSGGTVNPVPAPSIGAGYDARVVTAPNPAHWSIVPSYTEGGGAKIPHLAVTGTVPARNITIAHIYFRQGMTGDWVYLGSFNTNQPVRSERANIALNTSYYARIIYENAYGVLSDPTDIGPYTSPTDFAAFSAQIADGIIGQGWGATASEAAASNALVPFGVNVVRDAQAALQTAIRAGVSFNAPSGPTISYALDPQVGPANIMTTPALAQVPGDNFHGIVLGLAQTAAAASPLAPGRIGYAVELAIIEPSAWSRVFVRCMGFDNSGAWVFSDESDAALTSGFQRVGKYFDASTHRRYLLVVWGVLASGVSTAKQIYVWKPVLAQLPAAQTSLPIWSPSIDAYSGADVTSSNTAAAIAGQGNQATANANRGTTGSRPSSTGSWSWYANTTTNTLQLDVPSVGWLDMAEIPSAGWTTSIGATGSGTAAPGVTANVTLSCSSANPVGSVSYLWTLETNFSGVSNSNNGRSSSITYSKVIGVGDNIITTGTLRVIDAGTGETRFLPFSINWKDINET